MTRTVSSLVPRTVAALLFTLATGLPLRARAQAPAAAPVQAPPAVPAATAVFSTDLGHATVNPKPGLSVNYSVTATLPLASKAVNQKLRMTVQEEGLHEVTDANGQSTERQGTFTHYLTINTGKYKTLAQLKGTVVDLFRRFLVTNSTASANTDLGKIGDARYGGEMHFVAESSDVLRCDYTPAAPDVTGVRLKRRDVQTLLGILEPRG